MVRSPQPGYLRARNASMDGPSLRPPHPRWHPHVRSRPSIRKSPSPRSTHHKPHTDTYTNTTTSGRPLVPPRNRLRSLGLRLHNLLRRRLSLLHRLLPRCKSPLPLLSQKTNSKSTDHRRRLRRHSIHTQHPLRPHPPRARPLDRRHGPTKHAHPHGDRDMRYSINTRVFDALWQEGEVVDDEEV